MTSKHSRLLSLAVPLALVAAAWAQRLESSRLSSKVFHLAAPTGRMPLSQMLANGARHLRGDYITYGIEFKNDETIEPTVDVGAASGTEFGVFLEEVFRQTPQYSFEVASPHLVSVYPKGAKENPTDLLNLRVSHFDVDKVHAGEILAFPVQYIPELRARLYPETPEKPKLFMYLGPVAPGPEISLHLTNVTVRDILNATSVATETSRGEKDYPVGWTYRSAITVGQESPRWGSFVTLPLDWRGMGTP